MSISGYKDTDKEILLALSDKDLIKTCSLNKYLFRSVCDENFFYRKLSRTYPDTLKFFDTLIFLKDKTYKQYYLKVVYYVAKLLEDFNYIYIAGVPQIQYEIFKDVSKKIIKNDKEEFLINYEKLLYEAAKRGELELVKEAIKKGVDIHKFNEITLTYASGGGHLEILKYLVALGANIHANNQILRWASEKGHLEVVKYLVELGVNIHFNNDAALRSASAGGHLDIVKYLEGLGANIHANNDDALRSASQNGRLNVIKYLLSKGANPNAIDHHTLERADVYGYYEIIKYLASLNKK